MRARDPGPTKPLVEDSDDTTTTDDSDDNKLERGVSEMDSYMEVYKRSSSFSRMMEELGQQGKHHSTRLSGNLYRLFYVGRLHAFGENAADKRVIFGLLSVVLIQFIAPFTVFFWSIHQVDWPSSNIELVHYEFGSHKHGLSYLLTSILAVLFLLCFTLNGLKVIKTEEEMSVKMEMLLKYTEPDKTTIRTPLKTTWYVLGVMVNAFMPVVCAVTLFLLFIVAESPKDAVFDALGLIFLYKLDDIDGDLGFISSQDWDEEKMGDFYYQMVNEKIQTEKRPTFAKYAFSKEKFRSKFGSWAFHIASNMMKVLVFALPLGYFFTGGIVLRNQD